MTITSLARLLALPALAGTVLAACGDTTSTASPAAAASSPEASSPAASVPAASAPAASAPAAPAAPAPTAVTIKGFAFNAADVSVPVGASVTWTNQDPAIHTVTTVGALVASFDSGNLDNGKTFSYTFAKAGKYSYHCSIHSNMMGTVTAQ